MRQWLVFLNGSLWPLARIIHYCFLFLPRKTSNVYILTYGQSFFGINCRHLGLASDRNLSWHNWPKNNKLRHSCRLHRVMENPLSRDFFRPLGKEGRRSLSLPPKKQDVVQVYYIYIFHYSSSQKHHSLPSIWAGARYIWTGKRKKRGKRQSGKQWRRASTPLECWLSKYFLCIGKRKTNQPSFSLFWWLTFALQRRFIEKYWKSSLKFILRIISAIIHA